MITNVSKKFEVSKCGSKLIDVNEFYINTDHAIYIEIKSEDGFYKTLVYLLSKMPIKLFEIEDSKFNFNDYKKIVESRLAIYRWKND